ncbi:MAG: hypothetical protein ACFFA0_05100 [Promethearchaeota archaeon]
MNIIQIINRRRIKRSLYSKIKPRDAIKKVSWLEFENESILKFLTKYDLVVKRPDSLSKVSNDAKIQEYIELEQEPEVIFDVIEF